MPSRPPMLSVVSATAVVCLGPHGHQAIRAPDDSLEQILALWPGGQRHRATAVLPELVLHDVEHLPCDEGLMRARIELVPMLHKPGVEGVVKDDPHRGVGEQPGSLGDRAIWVGELPGISSAEALIVQPDGQLVQRRRPGEIPPEHLRDSRALSVYDVDAAGMLDLAGLRTLPVLFHPAGLVAEGDATRMESFYRPLAQTDTFRIDLGQSDRHRRRWCSGPCVGPGRPGVDVKRPPPQARLQSVDLAQGHRPAGEVLSGRSGLGDDSGRGESGRC